MRQVGDDGKSGTTRRTINRFSFRTDLLVHVDWPLGDSMAETPGLEVERLCLGAARDHTPLTLTPVASNMPMTRGPFSSRMPLNSANEARTTSGNFDGARENRVNQMRRSP